MTVSYTVKTELQSQVPDGKKVKVVGHGTDSVIINTGSQLVILEDVSRDPQRVMKVNSEIEFKAGVFTASTPKEKPAAGHRSSGTVSRNLFSNR